MNASKQRAARRIEAAAPALFALARSIHAHPETAFEEHHAAREITALMEAEGFAVERGVAGLPTAFDARAGNGDVHVAFCAEYDALPEIGHACGHNLIAAMSAGAALGAAAVAAEVGLTVHLFGTPGEEALDAGGKIVMLDAGCFHGIDAILMAHPAPRDVAAPPLGAGALWRVTFRGRGGHRHASADDAMMLAEQATLLLQRRLPAGSFVRGTRTSLPPAPNVAAEEVRAHWTIRAPRARDLLAIGEELQRCLEAAALATGAVACLTAPTRMYAEMHHAPHLAAAYRAHAEARGRHFDDHHREPGITTDLGNVSLLVPAIHPYIGLGDGAINHERAFAESCAGGEAVERCIVDGAIALAQTAIALN